MLMRCANINVCAHALMDHQQSLEDEWDGKGDFKTSEEEQTNL